MVVRFYLTSSIYCMIIHNTSYNIIYGWREGVFEGVRDFLHYQKEEFSIPLAGLWVSYEFFTGLWYFSAFMIPVAGASRRQHASVFFFLQAKMKSNYFLWALSSGTSLSCSERHSCCSRAFSSPVCFLIFSLLLSLSQINTHPLTPGMSPTDLTDQITPHEGRMWSISVEIEMMTWFSCKWNICVWGFQPAQNVFLWFRTVPV